VFGVRTPPFVVEQWVTVIEQWVTTIEFEKPQRSSRSELLRNLTEMLTGEIAV